VRGYTIRSYYATLSKVFPSSLARTEKNATRRAQIISLSNKIQVQGILHITAAANLPRSAPNFEWPLEDRGGCQDAYPECNRRLTRDRPLDWASLCFRPSNFLLGRKTEEYNAAVESNWAKWGKDVRLRLSFASEPTSPLRLAAFARTKQTISETRPASSTHGDKTHTPHHKALC
jgi:hypothetical protein